MTHGPEDALVAAPELGTPHGDPRPARRLVLEPLEDRTVLSVSILNNAGNGYAGLSFNQSGGYVPPDTSGAAGPSAYVETVNQIARPLQPQGHRRRRRHRQPVPLPLHDRRLDPRRLRLRPVRPDRHLRRADRPLHRRRPGRQLQHPRQRLRPRRLQDQQPDHAVGVGLDLLQDHHDRVRLRRRLPRQLRLQPRRLRLHAEHVRRRRRRPRAGRLGQRRPT